MAVVIPVQILRRVREKISISNLDGGGAGGVATKHEYGLGGRAGREKH